jgi:hypothetical protein
MLSFVRPASRARNLPAPRAALIAVQLSYRQLVDATALVRVS